MRLMWLIVLCALTNLVTSQGSWEKPNPIVDVEKTLTKSDGLFDLSESVYATKITPSTENYEMFLNDTANTNLIALSSLGVSIQMRPLDISLDGKDGPVKVEPQPIDVYPIDASPIDILDPIREAPIEFPIGLDPVGMSDVIVSDPKTDYNNIFGDFADITYDYTTSEVKESIVLRGLPYEITEETPDIRVSVRVDMRGAGRIQVDGVDIKEEGSVDGLKTVDVYNVDDALAFTATAPYAFDANGDRIDLTYRLALDKDGFNYTLLIPAKWLLKAVYPITIDPTWQIPSASSEACTKMVASICTDGLTWPATQCGYNCPGGGTTGIYKTYTAGTLGEITSIKFTIAYSGPGTCKNSHYYLTTGGTAICDGFYNNSQTFTCATSLNPRVLKLQMENGICGYGGSYDSTFTISDFQVYANALTVLSGSLNETNHYMPPVGSATLNATMVIANDTGGALTDHIWLTYNGTFGNLSTCVNGTCTFLWDFTGVAEGNYSLVFWANTTAGNTANYSDGWINLRGNTLPSVPYVNITNMTLTWDARVNSVKNCNFTYSDADTHAFSAADFRWYVNGSLLALNSTTLGIGNFSIADNLTCSVRVSDSYNWSIWYNSSRMTITHNTPNATSITVEGSASDSTNKTCNYTYSSADATSQAGVQYNWYVNGTSLGLNNYNLTTSQFRINDNITCTVRVNDTYGWGDWINSTSMNIGDVTPPSISNPTNVQDTFMLGGFTTMCVTVTDASGIQWAYFEIMNSTGAAQNYSGSVSGGNYCYVFGPGYDSVYNWTRSWARDGTGLTNWAWANFTVTVTPYVAPDLGSPGGGGGGIVSSNFKVYPRTQLTAGILPEPAQLTSNEPKVYQIDSQIDQDIGMVFANTSFKTNGGETLDATAFFHTIPSGSVKGVPGQRVNVSVYCVIPQQYVFTPGAFNTTLIFGNSKTEIVQVICESAEHRQGAGALNIFLSQIIPGLGIPVWEFFVILIGISIYASYYMKTK
jgi:hypothetical protein